MSGTEVLRDDEPRRLRRFAIVDASFALSAAEPSGWPPPLLPEIAFCGRSNVGKSTLLNMLLGHKLARVSRTPGRTRLINFFRVTALHGPGLRSELGVADLPGFGYARVSKSERATWRPLVERYLTRRDTLQVVLLLCDSRRAADIAREPEGLLEEAELCAWLLSLGRKVVPVMTKADKLAKHERKPAQHELQRLLKVKPVVFSSLSGEGKDELWRRVERVIFPPAVEDSQSAPG